MSESVDSIQQRMLNTVDDDYDKTDGSFIYDSTRPGAMIFSEIKDEIDEVQSKLDIENLSGAELSRFVYQRTGIVRKEATKATTTVIISGSAGAMIKIGDMVGTETLNFLSLEEKTIDETGKMNVLVACEKYGRVGNVPANSIKKFPVSLSGMVDVYNPEKVSSGYEGETDKELRERYYTKLQRPGKAGNIYHYEEWANAVVGVGGAKCIARWNGPLTVKVVIIDANKQPADEKLIKNVADYIEKERPFGANVTVVSATGVPLHITATLSMVDGYTEEIVKENIKKNIAEYLGEVAFKTTYISYARIGSIMIDTDGVLDYQNLQINGISANVPIGNEQIAIVGGVNE